MPFLSLEQCNKICASLKLSNKAFIDGKPVDAASGKTFSTENPATGKNITMVAACDAEDVDRAVKAARRAFESGAWSKMTPKDRKKIMFRFAELVKNNIDELAVLETLDSGKPMQDTYTIDIPESADLIAWHAEAGDKINDILTPAGPDIVSMIVREPIGVVAAILPWNFPLYMAAFKLGPALATGNSIIIKPAKLTSLSTIRLAEIASEAGIPDGVFNVVPGFGSTVGKAIGLHPDINLITFTGSTEVGRVLLKYSAESNLKRIALECGGKNPCVVMGDYKDLDTVAEHAATAMFWNMGENCSSNSRLIVHESIKDALLEKVIEKTGMWKMGNPFDPEMRLGPLIEKPHMEKVLSYIEKGKKEGAKLVLGGNRILKETGGYFVEPTIFDNVTGDMTIAREEIFGPVLGVIGFKDVEEGIRIANDTNYGLHASLWTSDVNLAHRASRAINAGTISVNCYSEGDYTTPFGGFKESGFFGRDKSLQAHEEYTETKTIWLKLS
jgi:4-(gamma-glutamylamino)butanal dehydrogenase